MGLENMYCRLESMQGELFAETCAGNGNRITGAHSRRGDVNYERRTQRF